MAVLTPDREPPRKWKMWALLEMDGTLHRVNSIGPEDEAVRGLIALGWFCIPVDVIESLPTERP